MTRRWWNDPGPDLVALAVVGGAAVLAGGVAVVRELVRILPNRDVPVRVDLAGVPHELLVAGGTAAEATEAVVRVSGLGPAAFALVLAAALVPPVATVVVSACFALLGGAFFRGEFFGRVNRVAVNVAAATLLVASVAVPSLRDTAASSALSSAGAGTGQAVVLGLDGLLLLAGFLLAGVGYAFQRGARLVRDTEGLV
ncbi:hypothetical protein ACFQHV_08465 [Promicromonospora thailandica]|uniref:DUF2975 family protein n=1 Tax=Promicromonospora thailandica TaxID=765201 RepID=A0A9X2G6T2_9MICO|nr:hypothetical protein [Promicromonospora thailandica]MCP2266638.1 hypothetical protein [Promicromonospora thailandica]BFF17285.1 hypothetical protein GCM10025730_08060 [Promicromonospora thailandica]